MKTINTSGEVRSALTDFLRAATNILNIVTPLVEATVAKELDEVVAFPPKSTKSKKPNKPVDEDEVPF